MVLIDTSVWIRFLVNRAPYSRELDRLLALDECKVDPFVKTNIGPR
jgi:predicted nucleic acid-binding protein